MLACGEEDKGLTYAQDVKPIFGERCTICHRPDGPSGIDIQNPLSASGGLLTSKNRFKIAHPDLTLPDDIVLPGDPDRSFLMYKIDPSLQLPPDPDENAVGGNGPEEAPAGLKMPLFIPLLEYEQVHLIEEWIRAGANTAVFQDPGAPATDAVPATSDHGAIEARAAIPPATRSFAKDIQPIIGTEEDLAATQVQGGVCTPSKTKVCPRCIYCHYEDGPNPPDLTDVFDPVKGLVNVKGRYRSDLFRVEPGNPEDSLLVRKIHYENFTIGVARSDYGSQMPYSFPPLTPNQLATVRQWILEGAKP